MHFLSFFEGWSDVKLTPEEKVNDLNTQLLKKICVPLRQALRNSSCWPAYSVSLWLTKNKIVLMQEAEAKIKNDHELLSALRNIASEGGAYKVMTGRLQTFPGLAGKLCNCLATTKTLQELIASPEFEDVICSAAGDDAAAPIRQFVAG